MQKIFGAIYDGVKANGRASRRAEKQQCPETKAKIFIKPYAVNNKYPVVALKYA